MTTTIRPFDQGDLPQIVDLALRAWAPVFASFESVLGRDLYHRIYPDWLQSQTEAVESSCRDETTRAWVSVREGRCVGFVTVVMDEANRSGEIDMLAVDPDCQRCGIGGDLTTFALERMREVGIKLAVVATGGDVGHAPARRTYEKAGFTPLPLVRYYRNL